jgi:prolyl 4-hydroxylase
MQVSRYRQGEQYRFHFDAFEGAPRVYTFLAYLNTPQAGGDTIFPLVSPSGDSLPGSNADDIMNDPALFAAHCADSSPSALMRFAPKQGDAILFTPMRPWLQSDELSLHGACPVTSGEKWVLQRWARPIYDPSFQRSIPAVPQANPAATASLGEW